MEVAGWLLALLLAVYLKFLPVDECSKCNHCRIERLRKKEEQLKLQDDYAHKMGIVDPNECRCSRCKKRL